MSFNCNYCARPGPSWASLWTPIAFGGSVEHPKWHQRVPELCYTPLKLGREESIFLCGKARITQTVTESSVSEWLCKLNIYKRRTIKLWKLPHRVMMMSFRFSLILYRHVFSLISRFWAFWKETVTLLWNTEKWETRKTRERHVCRNTS